MTLDLTSREVLLLVTTLAAARADAMTNRTRIIGFLSNYADRAAQRQLNRGERESMDMYTEQLRGLNEKITAIDALLLDKLGSVG